MVPLLRTNVSLGWERKSLHDSTVYMGMPTRSHGQVTDLQYSSYIGRKEGLCKGDEYGNAGEKTKA